MARLIATIACVFLLAGPAHARDERDPDTVPVIFDVGTRILIGIPLTIAGGVMMVPVGLFTAITRPTEIDDVFNVLVMGPVQYTWLDPLGYHPPRRGPEDY